jgi:HEAT repeat protein
MTRVPMRPRSASPKRWLLVSVVILTAASTPVGAQTPAPPLSTAGPALEELGRDARDTSRPEAERLELVGALGKWGTDQVREPLVALLDDPLPSIRAAAAQGLGWPGNQAAVAALRARVEAPGETAEVRAAALEALGKIGDATVRPMILAALGDPEPSVRGAALGAVALGPLVDPADRPSLLVRLATDDGVDRQMRAQAIQELAPMKDPAIDPALLQLLEHGPRMMVPAPSAAPTQQETMALRYREARDVRAWAANVLGRRRVQPAVPLLTQALADRDDFFLRIKAIEALAALRATAAVPALLQRLEDPVFQVRVAALATLGMVGDRTIVDPVLTRLEDEAAPVRIQAILTLAVLGDPRVRPRLEALRLTEEDLRVQRALDVALTMLAPRP